MQRGAAAAAAPSEAEAEEASAAPQWELRDEGAADKGVTKLGYVSTRPGAVLRLALTPPMGKRLSGGCARAELLARLGYLLSPRLSQGQFAVQCHGCACARLRGRFGVLSPFPVVDTYLGRSRSSEWVTNMTVTSTTEFSVDYHAGARDCVLAIRHEASPSETRVRIDSLYLWRVNRTVRCDG